MSGKRISIGDLVDGRIGLTGILATARKRLRGTCGPSQKAMGAGVGNAESGSEAL